MGVVLTVVGLVVFDRDCDIAEYVVLFALGKIALDGQVVVLDVLETVGILTID